MTTLRLIKENVSTKSTPIKSPGDVYRLMKFLAKEEREKTYVLHLNCRQEVVAMELVSVGTLTHSVIHPREIFKAAILNNSHRIICVHNHPSGDISPSADDKSMTHLLKNAGNLLGIPLADHVIIGSKGFTSIVLLEAALKEKEKELKRACRLAKIPFQKIRRTILTGEGVKKALKEAA